MSDINNRISSDDISLVDLISVLLKRKRLIVGLTALGAIGALAFMFGSFILPPEKSYLPNYYKAKAIILINDSGGGLPSMLGNAAGLAALAGLDLGGSSKSNGELVALLAKSGSTIDELNTEIDFTGHYGIKGKTVKSDTRAAALKSLIVANDTKTGTMSIAFQDINPSYAAKVVNQLVRILDQRYSSLSVNTADVQKEVLEKKLAEVQVNMDKLEARVKDFTNRHGVINVQAMAAEQVTVLAQLRSQLILKDMEIENYQKFSKIDDPVVQRLKVEKQALAGKIADIESGASVLPSQRDIPRLAFEYANLQRDLSVQIEVFKTLSQQYEVAKLKIGDQAPSFQVLELAETPEKKAGPARATIIVVVTLASFLLAVLLAFVHNAIENIMKDPEAMKKLRGAG
jgi:uncharacterized protein involved in exopolysaccharide biosynthesis